jgi:phosphonate transport system substrate-binding protein
MTFRALPRCLFIASLFLVGAGCEEIVEPQLEVPGGFDPTRWDPGPEPPLAPGEVLPDGVRFGLTPFYSRDIQAENAAPVVRYLGEELQMPVELVIPETYSAIIESLERREVDVAQISPFTCVQARSRIPELELIATAVAQGTTSYASYLVTRQDSAINSLSDARDKRIAFVDPSSGSGFLYPMLYFKNHQIDPDAFFSEVVMAGSHDKALGSLLSQRVELATVSSDTLVSNRAVGPGGQVRILANLGRIPYDCIAVHPGVPALLRHRLKRAFLKLSIHHRRGRETLVDYNLTNGFMPVPDNHYDSVHDAWLAVESDR